VLKGKYFPNSDFLTTTRRKRSIITWCAILHGRDILKRGLIKRVGSGETIDVWNDNRISSNSSLRTQVKLETSQAVKAADLMKDNGRKCDLDILNVNLTPMDIEAVLKIPLSHYKMEDFSAWAYERSGFYSVHSAYRLLKDIQIAKSDHV
jgi:hypothetical protein